ncbi:hypothetical protein BUALT_Bualt18G0068000 [Buddleja alternifolia]|uniref:Uncharacterized protein n=1 Tax=Buddleja alternifolia TaxID=168488 RepID=A0AAV6W8R2_9LAMI|nr:hypothetical protein BUALT_Bualt18G0068000 [Buddleja alternifolia]
MESARETYDESGGGGGGGGVNAVEVETIPAAVNGGGEAVVYKKGAWSKEEDEKLRKAVDEHGLRNWVAIEKYSGLARPAKNCRLRWLNYLRPNLKKYPFTEEEEQKILHLHANASQNADFEKKDNYIYIPREITKTIIILLPGRSDNDIKNFWHKRAKKCQKHHLPIYPPTIQDQQDTPTDSLDINNDDVYYPNFDDNSDQIPYVLTTDSSATTSIYSTQTPISTPKPQFHSSPSSLTTSHLPSPTNNFTKTNLLRDTPTSQPPQNSLLSPHQTSKSIEIPLVISDTTPQIQDSWQNRKPPILSSPQGRFRRFSEARAQSVSALLNTDSSPQMKCSLAMESPISPLKLKLSPGTPAVYSVTTDSTVLNLNKNSHTSGVSLSEFQLKSPSTAPLSPLHLRLSTPVPSDSSFKSNIPILDSTLELNSSTASVSLPSPRLNPELPPIPLKKVDPDHVIHLDSSSDVKTEPPSIQFHAHAVESDSNSEILDELKEAQEKVRLLKKKLRQRKISNKRTLPSDLTGSGSRTEVSLDRNASPSTGKEQLTKTGSRTKNMMKRTARRKDDKIGISKTGQFKRVKSESEMYIVEGENSETRTLSDDSLQREHPPGDILKRRNSMTFQEQMHLLNISDHNRQNNVNAPNSDSWCSSLESLFSESSTLVQDSFLIADLFDQKSGIEGTLASEGQEPLVDAFGPIYIQSTSTTLVKSGNDGHPLTYLQSEGGFVDDGNSLRQEIPHGLETKFTENASIDQYLTADLLDSGYVVSEPSPGGEQFTFQTSCEGNLAETQKLCEPTLLLQQHPGGNLLGSDHLVGNPAMEHEYPRGEPYSFQTPADGFCGGDFTTEYTSSQTCNQTWKQEPTQDQTLMESLLVENSWPEEQMAPQEQKLPTDSFGSVVDPSSTHSIESNWKGEPSYAHTVPNPQVLRHQGCDPYMGGPDVPGVEIPRSCQEHLIATLIQIYNVFLNYLGEVLKQELGHDYQNTMPDDLSSLLEFFPTSLQTFEWYNNGDVFRETEDFDEYDMDLGLDMSSSMLPITIADYM